uniref:Ig-like domain-containing protein n=1 Tax=Chelonoidis abingdonii TaxID=106734 RepID=A0A8C0HHI7_CHEAB
FHHLSSSPCPDRLSPVAPSVGQNVTLSVEGGLEPLRHFDWYRGRLADGSTRIFSYFPGQERPQRNGVQFTGREVGFPNGSLLLRGTQANDSGTYQVALQLVPQGSGWRGRTHGNTLSVPCTEKLAKPTVMPNQNQVPRTGPSPSHATLPPEPTPCAGSRTGRLGLSPDNRTLTMQNFTWATPGPTSARSGTSSAPTSANGPESTRIDPPGPVNLTLGSPLTLTCVADSVPALSYSWILNGNKLPQNHQGTYKCQAHNPITDRTAWASVAMLVTGRG